MSLKYLKIYTLLLFFLPITIFAKSLDNSQFSELMKLRLKEGQKTRASLSIDGKKLFGVNAINSLYETNNYASLWNETAGEQLLTEINQAVLFDGLVRDDYMLPGIEAMVKGQELSDLDTKQRVERELELTESFLRLNYHLRFGKVNPEAIDSNWNYEKRLDFKDPVEDLSRAIKDKKIKALLAKERPAHSHYHKLRGILAEYRKLETAGGWKAIDSGPTIKLGQQGKRITQVRERLIKTDELFAKTGVKELALPYNENLQQAIIRFQKQHSLDTDGKVGKNTLNALNLSVADRIDQIRLNLERLRWVMHELDDKFILVDIPGFKVILINNGKFEWQGKIQVGRAYTATPIFKGKLKYLEFNPTWTIPPGIIKRSILPGLKKDSDYLAKKGFLLLDLKGKELNPKSIDWNAIKGFPYMVRQPAGKNNALGLVKFIFPNSHFVFLHDTNHRELFDRNTRTFSAGCIRVENPFEFATHLLEKTPGWNRKNIDELVASGETKRINPKDSIDVLITYTTVGVDQHDNVVFKQDIYNRDKAVLAALNGKIKVAKDVKKALQKSFKMTE